MSDRTTPEELVRDCDEAQRAAILTGAAPMLIVAGAGSGKTRVLTRRIARRVLDGSAAPAHVLALTFTRRAAGELRGRLQALGLAEPVTAGTFHAVALGELRRLAAERGEPVPQVLGSRSRLLERVLGGNRARARQPARAGRPRTGRGPVRSAAFALAGPVAQGARGTGDGDPLSFLSGEIDWAKARGIDPSGYAAAAAAAGRARLTDPERVGEVYAAYERERRRAGYHDFDDLLSGLASAIERDPEVAATERWRFRHFFVDELQDANPAQLRLLEAWLGGRPDLCAVGDPRQAIYGWNGAVVGVVSAFEQRFPEATVLRLDTNHRSTPQVVAVAAAVLDRDAGARRRGGTAGDAAPARGTHDPIGTEVRSSPDAADGLVPSISAYPSDEDEVAAVVAGAARARRLDRGWAAVAVLARTNAQLGPFEQAFAAAGVPVASGPATAFLADPAVRDALDESGDPSSPRAFVALLDDLELDLRARQLDTPHPETPRLATPELGTRELGTPQLGAPQLGAEDAISDFLDAAREYRRDDPRPSVNGFLSWVRAQLRADAASRRCDAVTLSTFHRAKGLEWPVVFVTGLEDGFVPMAQARTAEALEEERRLLYVALSRAREELHCSWAERRRFGARVVERSPSPHLDAIVSARDALERLARPDRDLARRAIAASRELLAADRPAEPAVAPEEPPLIPPAGAAATRSRPARRRRRPPR